MIEQSAWQQYESLIVSMSHLINGEQFKTWLITIVFLVLINYSINQGNQVKFN